MFQRDLIFNHLGLVLFNYLKLFFRCFCCLQGRNFESKTQNGFWDSLSCVEFVNNKHKIHLIRTYFYFLLHEEIRVHGLINSKWNICLLFKQKAAACLSSQWSLHVFQTNRSFITYYLAPWGKAALWCFSLFWGLFPFPLRLCSCILDVEISSQGYFSTACDAWHPV